jgi:GNAT superfamily N-acetyltransferase
MAVEIKQVQSRKELKEFIKFNINLYKNNKYAVPPLILDETITLSQDKNPAFEFCESAYFLAYKEGKIAGRIAAIINRNANELHGVKNARFGWVDFIDDREVSKALFGKAEEWAKSKNMEAIIGPMGMTDIDYEGMLIDGFDQQGTMATIYNYPYYQTHIEELGYVKDIDWNEYLITIPDSMPERYMRGVNLLKQKYGLRTAEFKSRKELMNRYGEKVFSLWNICYKELYGASPLSQKQIDFYVKMYLSVIRLDTLSIVVNEDDEVVGFGISIPSLAKALQKAKGRLFPFGFIHLWRALKKNDLVDLLIVGIHPDYQSKGVTSFLFADLIPKYIKNGYKHAESNPELESNHKITAQWGQFEYKQVKKRRAFIKSL